MDKKTETQVAVLKIILGTMTPATRLKVFDAILLTFCPMCGSNKRDLKCLDPECGLVWPIPKT